jgi:DNA-damage-inducible protein D
MNNKKESFDKSSNELSVFDGKKIRKIWLKEEWWFVLEDIVVALTESKNPKDYLTKIKLRDPSLAEGWGQIVSTLPVLTLGGVQKMNCTNTEGAFRIIQSIPSPKAEPFKLWLARTGYERVQEINDPELAGKRMKDLYKAKGYPENWVEKRVRGIAIRGELTDEWKKRDVGKEKEYAILTAEISKATFDMTPKEYKKFKNLKRENLRDHMDDLELIFTMLGEASTTKITRSKNAQGFVENKNVAKKGGKIAGVARKELEKQSGEKISTKNNYLNNKNKKLL